MIVHLLRHLRAFQKYDPAANNLFEIALVYPGFHAMVFYRIGHFFYRLKLRSFARLINELGRRLTGIEIHPGAQIGNNFIVDHGMGVVIGETAIIGDNCIIYQGVTLGGTSLERCKRHPTLGNNVVVGSGAKVLGNITIGDNARIGANSVVLKDIPPDSIVVGIPGKVVKSPHPGEIRLDHNVLPDPVQRVISRLETRIRALEHEAGIEPPTTSEVGAAPTDPEGVA